jgi:hypothetical protein
MSARGQERPRLLATLTLGAQVTSCDECPERGAADGGQRAERAVRWSERARAGEGESSGLSHSRPFVLCSRGFGGLSWGGYRRI